MNIRLILEKYPGKRDDAHRECAFRVGNVRSSPMAGTMILIPARLSRSLEPELPGDRPVR